MPEPIPTVPVPPAPKPDRFGWVRRSITLRVVLIGVLVLLLLIPLAMVQDLIREREWRKQEAENEVSGTWGGPQTLTGPVVSVPYTSVVRVDAEDGSGRHEMKNVTEWAHFLPATLDVESSLSPQKRHRGIYDVVVYESATTLKGSFPAIGDNRLGVNDRLQWDRAVITLGISDLRSIKEQVRMEIGGRALDFEPGVPTNDVIGSGLVAQLDLDSTLRGKEITFTAELHLNGSTSFRIVPVGKLTKAHAVSDWPSPSASGAFLPDSTPVAGEKLDARWTVLHLNRPYPQEFLGSRTGEVGESAFGVDLILPVDEYQKSTRAAKYGVMLIVMVFTVFFFVEVLQKIRIHPIQYLLVGLALCIFYSLLIALSEHIGFGRSYILAAAAVMALVILYARSVFKMPRAVRLLTMILVLVYGFIFTIIHQEDYALLMGSIGLFLVLAVVMWLSRKIDWYEN